MTDKTGYKYSIKANQSLTSGMIAFEAYFAFDTEDDWNQHKHRLLLMFQDTEAQFTEAGYKCSSIIPNNMKDLASKKTQEKIGGAQNGK